MSWPTVALGEVVEVLSGFAFKSEQFNTDGRGLPLVRIRDVLPGRSETFYDGPYQQPYIVSDGDLLVGMDGEFNAAKWSGGPALLNQRVCKISTISNKLDQDYLFHLLPLELKVIEGHTAFVTVKHLSAKDIKAIQVLLPPLDEQRRIAAILDQADALRRKRRDMISRYAGLNQSLFLEMFGDWSRPGQKVSVVKIGPLLDFITSGSRGWAEHYRDSGSKFLRIQNVRHDELDLSDVAFVSAPNTVEAKRTRVEPGDVLLSITADLGRTAVIPEDIGEAFINQHLSILRSKAFVPRFLSAAISSPAGQRAILARNREGVKAGLNFGDIRSFEVPNVNRDAQLRFTETARSVDKLKLVQIDHLAHLDSLFASLQHRAFRGEL